MSLYDDLKSRNIVEMLSSMLNSGDIMRRESDGKFVAKPSMKWNTPWIFQKPSYRMNCCLWKDIIFHGIIERRLPKEKWFVPLGCQDCFKVVVRPKTIEQLLALETLQRLMNHASKCGVEIRSSVFGNYGGYFYNRGLKEGLNCYKMVRQMVDDEPVLGKNIKVILKRGCTEMEHGIGRSDQWQIAKEQIEFEMWILRYFVDDFQALNQPEIDKDYVRQNWLDSAYSIGDETVLKFKKPPYPDYITYHHLA